MHAICMRICICYVHALRASAAAISRARSQLTKRQDGWTALHFAAAKGHTSIVSMLLERKANTDAREEKSGVRVALHCRP
jgi:ankyrin repeat protein